MQCLVVADAREVAADFEERCHCQLHGGVPLTIGIDSFLDSRIFLGLARCQPADGCAKATQAEPAKQSGQMMFA